MSRQRLERKLSEAEHRFLAGTALHPSPLISLEQGSAHLAARAIDLLAPIGRGQRGLIVSPPGAGKTTLLQQICRAVAQGHPEIKIYCLLIDERPEEVTDFRRNANGEVFASSLDAPPQAHLKVVNDLMPRVFEAAAAGQDVLVLLDSLTRLTRAFHAQVQGGRTLSGGLSAGALEIPRQIFGAARKVEGMGSITILGTILIETNSLMDEVIFEEFKGTGNMELVLSRQLARERYFPAIDALKSSTRRSELLYQADTYTALENLRGKLAAQGMPDASKWLIRQLEKTENNQELLDKNL